MFSVPIFDKMKKCARTIRKGTLHVLSACVFVLMSNTNLGAGEIKQVRAFETFNAGLILSTDPSGITYHPKLGHLFIADSEISEMKMVWNCENVFEVSLRGDKLFNTFDARDPDAAPCPPPIDDEQREPAGITFNPFDGFFYVADDEEHAIMRYDHEFGAPIAIVHDPNADFEGITCDPSTGTLYAVQGVQDKVSVYTSELEFVRSFSVQGFCNDPEGIAFNERNKHLYLVSSRSTSICEITLNGDLVDEYDLSHFRPTPIDPEGLTFAPSSDPYDDRRNQSLYIADKQIDNMPVAANDRDGIVYEAAILPADFVTRWTFRTNRHSESHGTVHSNGGIVMLPGLPSTHMGNLTAFRDILIYEANTVIGNVTAGRYVRVHRRATVDGEITQEADVARVPVLRVSPFRDGGKNVAVREGQKSKLPPGSYSNVRVASAATLSFDSGEYFVQNMAFGNESTLAVDVSGGGVTIHVAGKMFFGEGSHVDIVPLGDAGSRYLTLEAASDADIMFPTSARFLGTLVAPKARVLLEEGSEFKGAIMAGTIVARKNAVLKSHSTQDSPALMTNAASKAGVGEDGKDELTKAPTRLVLEQNSPNPFNPQTVVSFQLPRSEHVVLRIYDAGGGEVALLANGSYAAGRHSVRWNGKGVNGRPVASGVYFYALQAGPASEVKRMILLK